MRNKFESSQYPAAIQKVEPSLRIKSKTNVPTKGDGAFGYA